MKNFLITLDSIDKHFSISVGRDIVRNSIGSTWQKVHPRTHQHFFHHRLEPFVLFQYNEL